MLLRFGLKPKAEPVLNSVVPGQGMEGTEGTQRTEQGPEATIPGPEATAPKNNSNAVEIVKGYDPTDSKNQSIFTRLATKMPAATNAKTAALGMMAVIASASAVALQLTIDNSSSLKAAAQGASNLPMVGAVMAPMVMIAILLEMEKLNQSLRVFLFKINHVLKQMMHTVQLIAEVSTDFGIVLNDAALAGITSEMAELTEILALYYKVYAETGNTGANTVSTTAQAQSQPTSRFNKFTSSVKNAAITAKNTLTTVEGMKSAASKIGSFAVRMANKLNTFASVEANKSKALDNIVVANMYFNMLFSQMEFQLKMISQDGSTPITRKDGTPIQKADGTKATYKDLLEKIRKSEAYQAITSYGTVPVADTKLANLIKNLKDDPNVTKAATNAGDAAVIEEDKEQAAVDQDRPDSTTGGGINRRYQAGYSCQFAIHEPFIVDRILRFFEEPPRHRSKRSRRRRNRRRKLTRKQKRFI